MLDETTQTVTAHQSGVRYQANAENKKFKVVFAAATQLHLFKISYLNVQWPVCFCYFCLSSWELKWHRKKNLHGTATKLKVMASVPFHRSLPGCSAIRPLRDGAHIGALWIAGDSCPRGWGGGRPLTALCRCCSFSFFLILKNSLCWRETKLTAAYSSSAAKTKSRHTAIQMSMAFT